MLNRFFQDSLLPMQLTEKYTHNIIHLSADSTGPFQQWRKNYTIPHKKPDPAPTGVNGNSFIDFSDTDCENEVLPCWLDRLA